MKRRRQMIAVGAELVQVSVLTGVAAADPARATGYVFHDRNGNGVRDSGEEGLPGVGVSNQLDIVETDAQGRWSLPVTEDTTLFVIKPRGWRTAIDAETKLPRFYYTHKPAGSPDEAFLYKGVKPTGPLPAPIDFPLYRQAEPETFKAILFGDTQPRNEAEIQYMAHDVIEELIGTDAAFGVTLGDIVFDDLSIHDYHNRNVALIGIPWYNVIGNHDLNFRAVDDRHADETFERIYGPNYYAFDHGPVHFVVLDNVEWIGRTPEKKAHYVGRFGAEQLAFVQKDLAGVPEGKLVILMMHIPLTGTGDREALYRLIKDRPYCMSISAHLHTHKQQFLKQKDGWRGAKPHHHVINVTVCGSWWKGSPDELEIPHATMRGGAPNGYSVLTFDGRDASRHERCVVDVNEGGSAGPGAGSDQGIGEE